MKRAAVLVIAACTRRAPIMSCDDDLRGVYVAGPAAGAPGAAPGDERWMVLDNGATLEAYPLFPDGGSASDPPGLEIAPRVIDLERPSAHRPGPAAPGAAPPDPAPAPLTGTLRRGYLQRAERCEAHVAVRVTRCAGDALELVLGDPAPPLGFAPCTWPAPGPSRVVRWRRD
jgi:hypothetical protein